MRTRHYIIIVCVLVVLVIIGILSRSGREGDMLGDINWRDFDCKNDADRPYISILHKLNGAYEVTILIPYCDGDVEFTSDSLLGTEYRVVFTATPGTKSNKKHLLFHQIKDIPAAAETVKVAVIDEGVEGSTTVVTTDADDESSGMPLNEVVAMHYDDQHGELVGFVYGTTKYDPTPDHWVRHSMPVLLRDTVPAARTTFIRIPMDDPAEVESNYKVWLRFGNGQHGRSFTFTPSMQQ